MAWSHWRNPSHHEGAIAAGVEAIVVGTEVEVENAAPRRIDLAGDLESGFSEQVVKLSNKPLQRTWACQLSVDVQRAGAARLNE